MLLSQDSHVFCDTIAELDGSAMFAVLDGHGGTFTAMRGCVRSGGSGGRAPGFRCDLLATPGCAGRSCFQARSLKHSSLRCGVVCGGLQPWCTRSRLRRHVAIPQEPSVAGEAAWKAAFLAVDDQLRTEVSTSDVSGSSGSTVVAVLVTPTHYVIANCGSGPRVS